MAVSHSRDVMGTEHSLLNLAPELSARGFTVVLAARPGGELEKRWRTLGFDFVGVELPERGGVRTSNGSKLNSLAELVRLPFLTVLAAIRVAAAAKRVDAEVIHSNSILTHFDCALAGWLTRRKALVELHDIVAPGVGRLLLGIAVALASRAVATSTAVRDQLPTWARRRAVVIAQGIDVEKFSPVGAPTFWRNHLTAAPQGVLVAAVGRIDPEKGLHTLVGALAELRRRGTDAHLALVGAPSKDDGSYLEELLALADELIPGAFRILPPVEDVAAVLRAVDVLACPSVEEPFGLIILEAQACGVPVVVSASGGPLDFITDHSTGMLVRPGDPHAAASAVEELINDPALRERIVATARERVENEYTAQVRAEHFAKTYREVLGCPTA
ncbi:glycosyltransferase family 4 protein [Mycolicibacterium pyrenivorans]|uniref:glycosyltransferase family 4 protein n=1 Tax=Mycolicibacterium pyrenivorans TaxID=187102 RepID=UPI0021F2FD6D|nr:glycosyltransferase family 4 protein [Mycolicibacterium pyrenivorans]MCV7152497.1 glycosyltransferase family 4 protein [Mycolicibacterium pyrenivorans]